jgi:hypothetical protein
VSVTDIITASGAAIAALAIVVTVIQYRLDQRQQRAAQTREVLQAVFDDCSRFLHPLNEDAPYPILHTSTAIIKELRSDLREPCQAKDVLAKLHNCDFLLSICVEGWVSSTEILRMMNIVDDLERKASSHNLRGKILLICEASFLLAGIVAQVCSPKTFYDIMRGLDDPECCKKESAQVILDELAIELQKGVCQAFNAKYKETIKQCLYFIQIAARAFLHISDARLVRLAQVSEACSYTPIGSQVNKTNDDLVSEIEQETSIPNRIKQVWEGLVKLKGDLDPQEYDRLCKLFQLLDKACFAL